MEWWNLLVPLVPSVLTGIVGYLTAVLRRRTDEDRATAQIIKALGRKEIMSAYRLHVVEKRKLTVERFDQITEIFEAYTTLGGNGTAKRMYEEIKAKRPWIVTD